MAGPSALGERTPGFSCDHPQPQAAFGSGGRALRTKGHLELHAWTRVSVLRRGRAFGTTANFCFASSKNLNREEGKGVRGCGGKGTGGPAGPFSPRNC